MNVLTRFLAEVRRRRVHRVVALYIVGGWVLLQVADLALESFGFPDQAMRFVWIAVFAGFPLAILLGWRYDFSSQGIRLTPPADPRAKADLSLKTADYVILSAFVVLAGFVALRIFDRIGDFETSPEARIPQRIAFNTIAVLPLENMSGDPGQNYLASGMQDALITSLSKISSLRITSKDSARIAGNRIPNNEIAARLGVAKLIDGSVTREGARVRVNVQLIDGSTDENIWAESYERDFSGLLSLQNEIARAVARSVQAKLLPEEEVRLVTGQTVNRDTYDAYLRGIYHLHQDTPEGYRNGIEIMTAAVGNDPTSALTYAGLAYGHAKLGHNAFGVVGAAPRAKAAADRALELDDHLAEAHLAMGMYYLYYEWNWEKTEEHLFEALNLNSSLTPAHYHLAWYYELMLDSEKALYHGEMTKTLDPLSPFYTGWLVDQYRSAGMYDEAIAEATITLEFIPNSLIAWFTLGSTYAEIGEYDKALDAHERLRDIPFFAWGLAVTYAMAGQVEETKKILDGYGDDRRSAFAKTIIYGALEDREQALKWMRITKEEKLAWYPWLITWAPQMKFMHDTPEWREFVRELKLERAGI